MVDVGSKQVTRRTARAQAIVHLPTHVSEALLPPSHTKGDAVRELVGPKVSAHVLLSTKGCYNAVKAGRRTNLDWNCVLSGPHLYDCHHCWRDGSKTNKRADTILSSLAFGQLQHRCM